MVNQDIFSKLRSQHLAYEESIYMNHAALSPLSLMTKKAFDDYWNLRSHPPVDIFPDFLEIKNQFKNLIGQLINGQSNQIAITQNTGHGLNIVTNGLTFSKGDRIILVNTEFPANIYPFLNLKRYGVEIDWITPVEGKISTQQIYEKLTKKTKLVCLSFVQFLSGYKAPIQDIGKLCREHDCYFILDGTQGVGACPIDVTNCYVDALAVAGHKWLMWPMGVGFLYLGDRLKNIIYPAQAGWLSVKDCWNLLDYNLDFLDTADKFEIGTNNCIGITLAYDTIKEFLKIGIDQIYEKISLVTDVFLKELKLKDFKLISSFEKDQRSGIISFEHPESERIFEELKSQSIYLSVREGALRISPHCLNTQDEAYEVISRISSALK